MSQNTIDIISRIDSAGMWNYGQFGAISARELLSALRNFRKLAREADLARLQDEANEEEFEILHAIHSKIGRDMTVRVIFALIEKVVNALTGSTSQFYAYAALSSYSKQVDVVFEIMELGGNMIGARALAEHLPA